MKFLVKKKKENIGNISRLCFYFLKIEKGIMFLFLKIEKR